MGRVSAAFVGTISSEIDTYVRLPACWVIRFGSVRLILVAASHDSWDLTFDRPKYTPTASRVVHRYKDLPAN